MKLAGLPNGSPPASEAMAGFLLSAGIYCILATRGKIWAANQYNMDRSLR